MQIRERGCESLHLLHSTHLYTYMYIKNVIKMHGCEMVKCPHFNSEKQMCTYDGDVCIYQQEKIELVHWMNLPTTWNEIIVDLTKTEIIERDQYTTRLSANFLTVLAAKIVSNVLQLPRSSTELYEMIADITRGAITSFTPQQFTKTHEQFVAILAMPMFAERFRDLEAAKEFQKVRHNGYVPWPPF